MEGVSIRRAWDVQGCWNPWLSVGFHFDHTDPSLTLHLPGLILAVGRLKQPGFAWGVRRLFSDDPMYGPRDCGADAVRSVLDEYEDPQTSQTGVEVVRGAAEAIAHPSDYYADSLFREPSPGVLKRMIGEF